MMALNFVPEHIIRREAVMALVEMFTNEVPENRQFTKIVAESNEDFLQKNPHAIVDKQHRVKAEKHGACRSATKEEMATLTRIFRVMGMHPVNFYDLANLKVIATAFRAIDETIEESAFRMFCSMLHPAAIPQHLKETIEAELAVRRTIDNPKFSKRLFALLTKGELNGGLKREDVDSFIKELIHTFGIDNGKIINFDLYKTLREENDVFADIICLGINLNHLTPRAYNIQDAAERLVADGIPMKDGGIEGPPIREDAVNIQLNQTSRKAPGEQLIVSNHPEVLKTTGEDLRLLKIGAPKILMASGEDVKTYLGRISEALKTNKLVIIEHKARFGEIESRGVALTESGEALYKSLLKEHKFKTDFPKTHEELFNQNLAYYNFEVTNKGLENKGSISINDLPSLVQQDYLHLIPQTYNDFLAASAAGIFKSNLSEGTSDNDTPLKIAVTDNMQILQTAMGRNIISHHIIHKAEQANSILAVYNDLQIQVPLALKAYCESSFR